MNMVASIDMHPCPHILGRRKRWTIVRRVLYSNSEKENWRQNEPFPFVTHKTLTSKEIKKILF